MPAPRIAPIDPPYPPDVQAEFDKLMRGAPPLLLFRTVARNPRVLRPLCHPTIAAQEIPTETSLIPSRFRRLVSQ